MKLSKLFGNSFSADVVKEIHDSFENEGTTEEILYYCAEIRTLVRSNLFYNVQNHLLQNFNFYNWQF